MCRDFLLALRDGVEEQVLQTGQDACLPSPAGKKNKNTQKSEKSNSTVKPSELETWEGNCSRGKRKGCLTARRSGE